MFFGEHELAAFMARVAFCARLKRAEFTEEEKLIIENCHFYRDSPDDVAYMLLNYRAIDSRRLQNACD